MDGAHLSAGRENANPRWVIYLDRGIGHIWVENHGDLMKALYCRVAIALALLFQIAAYPAAARQPVPLSAYGALPNVEDAAISPNGERIAALITLNGVRQFIFFDASLNLISRLGAGDTKVRDFEWVGNDRLLLISSKTEDLVGFTTDKAEFRVAQLFKIGGDEPPHIVFSETSNVSKAIFGNYGSRLVDGKWVLHFGALEYKRASVGTQRVNFVFDHGRPYLYAFDVQGMDARRLDYAAGEGSRREWLVDAGGRIAARLEVSLRDGDWTIDGPGGNAIAKGNARNANVGLIGLGFDGRSAIFLVRDENNFTQWYEVPLAGGEPTIFREDNDIERLYFNKRTGNLMGFLDADAGPVFVDDGIEKTARAIRKAFPQAEMRMMDWTPDFSKVLVRTSGNRDSGTWFLVDVDTGKAAPFAHERALPPEAVGPISTVQYRAGDGLEMDGILTLPPDREAKNLPVIMLPHGGPHSRSVARFDWWAQAFASRGYAVFQPNFRGSTNRGDAFRLAGYGEWGRKMQSDISDGLTALAKDGIVDPSRACIVGASYGGYAALAGVTVQQGLYRCAVAVSPVSDIKAMYTEDYRASGKKRITKGSLLDQLGPRDTWDDVSPRRFASRADAPVMLIHGREDTVVPYSHSHKMADALKDAGKPYELVPLEGEDHWLSLSKTRLQMLEAAVGFVEKHNPADAPLPPPAP